MEAVCTLFSQITAVQAISPLFSYKNTTMIFFICIVVNYDSGRETANLFNINASPMNTQNLIDCQDGYRQCQTYRKH